MNKQRMNYLALHFGEEPDAHYPTPPSEMTEHWDYYRMLGAEHQAHQGDSFGMPMKPAERVRAFREMVRS